MKQALDGLRVVDFSNGFAGALVSQLLCDYGADVVHVEPPGGSPLRGQPGFYFWERGKRSAVLDLRRAEERDRLGQKARARASTYTAERMAQAMAAIYADVPDQSVQPVQLAGAA